MKEANFKYDHESIGKAFFEELKNMGYKTWKEKFESHHTCVTIDSRGEIYPYKLDFGNKGTTFQLESQYGEALQWAKDNINVPKFKEGEWYHVSLQSERNVGLIRCSGNPSRRDNYGFWRGKYRHNLTLKSDAHKTQKATPEEVEQALIKEAKRRGFEVGIKYKCKFFDNNTTSVGGKFKYCSYKDYLTDGHGGSVYHKGEWAEIIDNRLNIAGHKIKAKNEHFIGIGCQEFSKSEIITVLNIYDKVGESNFVDFIEHLNEENVNKLRKLL